MSVVSFTLRPFYSRGKRQDVDCTEQCGWIPGSVWTLWGTEDFCLWGIEPWLSSPWLSLYWLRYRGFWQGFDLSAERLCFIHEVCRWYRTVCCKKGELWSGVGGGGAVGPRNWRYWSFCGCPRLRRAGQDRTKRIQAALLFRSSKHRRKQASGRGSAVTGAPDLCFERPFLKHPLPKLTVVTFVDLNWWIKPVGTFRIEKEIIWTCRGRMLKCRSIK
jgi:hypothetical protein